MVLLVSERMGPLDLTSLGSTIAPVKSVGLGKNINTRVECSYFSYLLIVGTPLFSIVKSSIVFPSSQADPGCPSSFYAFLQFAVSTSHDLLKDHQTITSFLYRPFQISLLISWGVSIIASVKPVKNINICVRCLYFSFLLT